MNTYVVKRSQVSEPFDSLKLHQSIVAACLSVRALEGDAHHTAERVCRHVLSWLAAHSEVTSADIRRKTAHALKIYHPDASYMYEHHQLIA